MSIDNLVKSVEKDIEESLYDGATLLLARDGQVVLHKALGFARRDAGLRLGLDHVFNVFSVAKALTAIATFIQIERGNLSLGMPVAEIIPEFANRGKEQITIFHLLTHMSGLSAELPKVPFGELGNLQTVVQAICEEELAFAPGTEVLCSSAMGFSLLGEAVRRLSQAMIELATTNQTGNLPDHIWDPLLKMRGWAPIPAYFGLAFYLRGEGMFPHAFGSRASPRTFGSLGLGSTVYWVDPVRNITFVCFTSGLMEESRSVERFQRLSDLALAAL